MQNRLTPRSFFRALVALALGLFVLSAAAPAEAAGRVVWKKTTIQERVKKEAWTLEFDVYLNRAPDVAYVPVKFEFKPIALYQRLLLDGQKKPVEKRKPITRGQTLIEGGELGFLDPRTGDIQKRTRFRFKVTRGHGFRAGEYRVSIRDGRTNRIIGRATKISLKGENEVDDRRSITFQPRDDKKAEKKKESEKEKEARQEAEAAAHAEQRRLEEEAAMAEAEAAYREEQRRKQETKERPGGGCHHGPTHGEHLGWGLIALAFAIGLWLRRRA